MRVRQLQLITETYTSSRELRAWCERNRNRCYVPEWLLGEWGITVDATLSGVAWPNRATIRDPVRDWIWPTRGL